MELLGEVAVKDADRSPTMEVSSFPSPKWARHGHPTPRNTRTRAARNYQAHSSPKAAIAAGLRPPTHWRASARSCELAACPAFSTSREARC